MKKITLGRDWPGVIILPVIVLGLLALGTCSGCSIVSVRQATEHGDGDQNADTIGAKGRLKLDSKIDADADVDGAAMPLSELGGD